MQFFYILYCFFLNIRKHCFCYRIEQYCSVGRDFERWCSPTVFSENLKYSRPTNFIHETSVPLALGPINNCQMLKYSHKRGHTVVADEYQQPRLCSIQNFTSFYLSLWFPYIHYKLSTLLIARKGRRERRYRKGSITVL